MFINPEIFIIDIVPESKTDSGMYVVPNLSQGFYNNNNKIPDTDFSIKY
jgi:hypothetical protein